MTTTSLAALPTVTQTAKPALVPVADGRARRRARPAPGNAATGTKASIQVLRLLMADNGVQVLGPTETGDPSGTAWAEAGEIDHRGHDVGIRLVDHLDEEVDRIVGRIRELLDAGWQRVDVVTDHGWLLLPGGMEKVELPPATTDVKKGRCARLKDGAVVDVADRAVVLGPGRPHRPRPRRHLLRGQQGVRARRREPPGVHRAPAHRHRGRGAGGHGRPGDHQGQVARPAVPHRARRRRPTGVVADLRALPADPNTSIAEEAKETIERRQGVARRARRGTRGRAGPPRARRTRTARSSPSAKSSWGGTGDRPRRARPARGRGLRGLPRPQGPRPAVPGPVPGADLRRRVPARPLLRHHRPGRDRRGARDRRALDEGAHRAGRRGGAVQVARPREGQGQDHRPAAGPPRRQVRRLQGRAAEPAAQRRPHRRRAGQRARADAHRRLLRRGHARVHRRARRRSRAASRSGSSRSGRSRCRPATRSRRSSRAGRGSRSTSGATCCCAASASSRRGSRAREQDVLLARMVPFVVPQLQRRRARPARHRQVAPVPAGVAVRPPRLRRQGDHRQHVRQQHARAGAASSPSTTSSASTRSPASPSTRRKASTSSRATWSPASSAAARRASAPTAGSSWSATSTSTSHEQLRRGPPVRADAEGDARRHRVHGPHPRLPARAGTSRSSTRRYFTAHFGFVSDFLAECWSQLRRTSRLDVTQGRLEWGSQLSGRDRKAANNTVNGLLQAALAEPGDGGARRRARRGRPSWRSSCAGG